MKGENSTKEKLIIATMQLLEKKDGKQISIREIAELAGQNSAAISYHFGGKEKLVEIAMLRHKEILLKIFTDILEEKEMSKEKVEQFATRLVQYLIQYEGAYRTGRQIEMRNIKDGMESCDHEFTGIQMKALKHMVGLLMPQVSEKVVTMKAVQFISSLAYPAIYLDMFGVLEQDITVEVFLDQYINQVIETLFNL